MTVRPLRSGFTTGTCGAAAAKAAAVCLLTGEIRPQVEIVTPKGIVARLSVELVSQEERSACFRVRKDSGDDPDVTNGAWIYGAVEIADSMVDEVWYQSEDYPHLCLTGGEGIGMVTKPGLSCPVGKYAINPVPRKMIFEAVEEVCGQMEWRQMLLIRIMIPQGVELAASTFNPKLGIAGGISVLGTSGIVEPMSEQALLDTIQLEIHMKALEGVDTVILTPGNYGENFVTEELGLSLTQGIKCSNFVADAMRMVAKEKIRRILFVGHIGKLVKVAGGVENTHSRYGDRRMEIMADCLDAAVHGEKVGALASNILGSNTTEEALDYLLEAGCLAEVMETIGKRICLFLEQWTDGAVEAEVVTFSSTHGILYQSRGVDNMIEEIKIKEKNQRSFRTYED